MYYRTRLERDNFVGANNGSFLRRQAFVEKLISQEHRHNTLPVKPPCCELGSVVSRSIQGKRVDT